MSVPVAVVDVGSNTVRLQASADGRTVLAERAMLHLGAEIERDGGIPPGKLAETAGVVARYVADARAVGASPLEVLIASPGRQAANGRELRLAIERAAECRVRILSAVEEAHLAFYGALACADLPPGRRVAVVDVGGGSAQVVVGSRKEGPLFAQSIDLGSQRLASRLLSGDPPGAAAMEAARAEADRYLEGFDPPAAESALAVGGSARALKRVAGVRLGRDELERALRVLATTPAAAVVAEFGVGAERARTLPAGAVLLAALGDRIGSPLRVTRGGLREGALLALEAEAAAAA